MKKIIFITSFAIILIIGIIRYLYGPIHLNTYQIIRSDLDYCVKYLPNYGSGKYFYYASLPCQDAQTQIDLPLQQEIEDWFFDKKNTSPFKKEGLTIFDLGSTMECAKVSYQDGPEGKIITFQKDLFCNPRHDYSQSPSSFQVRINDQGRFEELKKNDT